jgi:hypothetical protein
MARVETQDTDSNMHVHIPTANECPALPSIHVPLWMRLFTVNSDPTIDLDAICVDHRLLAHNAFRRYIVAQGGIAVSEIAAIDPCFGTLVRAHGSLVSAPPIFHALFELMVILARGRVGDSLPTAA